MMIDHDTQSHDRQWLNRQIHRASKLVAVDIDAFDDQMMNNFLLDTIPIFLCDHTYRVMSITSRHLMTL